jgi:hypothetical protein
MAVGYCCGGLGLLCRVVRLSRDPGTDGRELRIDETLGKLLSVLA